MESPLVFVHRSEVDAMSTADELDSSGSLGSAHAKGSRPHFMLDRRRTITIVTVGHIIAALMAFSLFRYVDGLKPRLPGDIRLEQATIGLIVVLVVTWSVCMVRIFRASRPPSRSGQ